jgi:hypothetical protein
MALENLNELSTDESSGGEETDDQDVQKIVDDVVSAIHTRFMKKKKKQVKREEKKSCLASRILVVEKRQISKKVFMIKWKYIYIHPYIHIYHLSSHWHGVAGTVGVGKPTWITIKLKVVN